MDRKIIFLLILLLLVTGCTYKVEDTKELMGTIVTITVYDSDKGKAELAVMDAFEEISRIDKLLSNYNNESEVYLLNKEGMIDNPSVELSENIKKARYYSELSNGAFDITVQPILDLYSKSFSEKGVAPGDDEINNVLQKVSYDYIYTKPGLILFRTDGMSITLGGIAKGYAIDQAINVLRRERIKHALVNAGGDMRAIGNKGNEDWQIALQNPRNKEEFITVIPLNDKSVVTSGDYERYFDENKTFHHIIDPRTGYSATELMSVTIIANNAWDADAISTSVFVLGKEKGLELIESLNGVEGLIITREKEIVKS
ncbi:MAG: FAD:protein FMN transferase, partial [Nanoarchaeota archaeon]